MGVKKKFTPKQALDILDKVVSSIQTDRPGHKQLEECVEIIKNAIKPITRKGTKAHGR